MGHRFTRRPRPARAVAFVLATAAAACAPLADLGLDTRPVSIDVPPDRATAVRLAQATSTLTACQAWHAEAGLEFVALADRRESETCQVVDAGRLIDGAAGSPTLSPRRPMMACSLSAAYALWRRQVVDPAARELLGSDVQTIEHLGVYACRSVYGRPEARPSAHSSARAIDIAGVRLRDGRRVSVARDWTGDDPEARFLRRIRDGACLTFGVTLSPDYNVQHADHLHLEAGAGRLCR